VAQHDGEDLVYLGSVGSGFTDALLGDLVPMLDEMAVGECPCTVGPVPKGPKHHWVRPVVAVEVKYKELTDQGLLRQPSFSRLRTDKLPTECVVEPDAAVAEVPKVLEAVEERIVPFTNPDKVFWPEEGYTKGDLIEYHRAVAEWMLPYLEFAPEWIRRVTVWSEGSERELSYFVADDLESLLYVINLGTIPLHIWSSRIPNLSSPDWCILDLDPKDAPFAHVVDLARTIHDICEEIGLPSFAKTSGSSGIHVLVPLGGRLTYEQSRTLAQLLGRVAVAERTDVATLTRSPDRREGKVYVDFVQNGHGRLLVAPFSVRPLPGATVSAPVKWTEVNKRLRISNHTITSMPRRMQLLKADPLRPVLELEPDLLGALERLTHWFD
jgi:bifunctional non-homologous end joining protein LigD